MNEELTEMTANHPGACGGEFCPDGTCPTCVKWAAWNPWEPYADYDAYHAAHKAIADVLGWAEVGPAIEVAKAHGQSSVYTGAVTGKQWVVKWDPQTGATIAQIK